MAGPSTLTYELLRRHLVGGDLVPGPDVRVAVDQVLVEDATGTMTAMQFEMLGADEVAVPLAVLYMDHNVLQIDHRNMQDHRYLRSSSARYGLRFLPTGRGTLALRPSGALRPARPAAGRRRLAHHHVRRAGHVRPLAPRPCPPLPQPPPGDLDGRVVIVVGDDTSTGDLAADRAVAMAAWSNIAECARWMFRRVDPEFHDRARAWGGGLIVAGHDYGQGSSREHAALAPAERR